MKKTFSIVNKFRFILILFIVMKAISFVTIYFSNQILTNGLKEIRDNIRIYNIATRIKEISLANKSFLEKMSFKNYDTNDKTTMVMGFQAIFNEMAKARDLSKEKSFDKTLAEIEVKLTTIKNRELLIFDQIGTVIKDENELKTEALVLLQLELEFRDDLLFFQNALRQSSDNTFEEIYKKRNIPFIIYSIVSLIFIASILWLGSSAIRNLKKGIDNFLTATSLAQRSNLNHQAQIIFNDEIGRMTEAFNQMINNLKLEKSRVKDIGEEKNLLENEIQIRKFTEAALENANKELEAFSYSVSHDLRTPLRAIDGFSQALLEDYKDKLDENGKNYLHYVREASQKMSQLIDDILSLSRITRSELKRKLTNLSDIAQSVIDDLYKTDPNREIKVIIHPNLIDFVDEHLLRVVLANLIGNSWKFTSKTNNPIIEFGMKMRDNKKVYFVRDNGAGFDMNYSNKLFGAFQRLHAATEFPGTGIGLATVARIIHRHSGAIWAEGEVNKGASFYFTVG